MRWRRFRKFLWIFIPLHSNNYYFREACMIINKIVNTWNNRADAAATTLIKCLHFIPLSEFTKPILKERYLFLSMIIKTTFRKIITRRCRLLDLIKAFREMNSKRSTLKLQVSTVIKKRASNNRCVQCCVN